MKVYSSQRPVRGKTVGKKSKTNSLLCWLIGIVLLTSAPPASAQQPKKLSRIGVLSPFTQAREAARSGAIRLALQKLGYVEGQNIAIEYRYADGKYERYPELAAELARRKVDVILAAGNLVGAAKNATKTIPIVMMGQGVDPVEAGFVDSLAQPGGNVTGITLLAGKLGEKRLELIKEAVPQIARVALLYETGSSGGALEANEVLPVAARTLGLTLRSWQVGKADEFDKTFAAILNDRFEGIYALAGQLMLANGKRIAEFASKNRLPSIYSDRDAVESGGLMSYAADLSDSYRRVAYYVDRILKGAKPADLPVEQPTKFELSINLKTAKQIGLNIPPSLLYRADKVIR